MEKRFPEGSYPGTHHSARAGSITARSNYSGAGGMTSRSNYSDTTSRGPLDRTPRTPKDNQQSKGMQASPVTKKPAATLRTKSIWSDKKESETDPMPEFYEDVQQDFWSKLWQAAGYVPVGGGAFALAEGGIVGSKATDADVKRLVEKELAAQELLYSSENSTQAAQTTRLASRRANEADDHVRRDSDKLIEYARIADFEKARELVHATAHRDDSKEKLDQLINGRDSFGWTALHWVAEGCLETSELKVLERKLDIMKMLMKFESTINLMAKTNKGNTALVHAIWNGNLKACQLMLKKDPRLAHEPTQRGWTALHWAANGQKMKNTNAPKGSEVPYKTLGAIAQLLLRRQYAVHLDAQTQAGDTALHIAAARGFKDVAQLLLISGASVNLENLQGQTPLHVAAEHDKHDLMEVFISFNAHLDAEDESGRSPAALYAIRVVQTLRLRFCGNWIHLDEWDKRETEASFRQWLDSRGISSCILSPEVEAEKVFVALSKTHALTQAPDGLSAAAAAALGEQVANLKMLLLGLKERQSPTLHRVSSESVIRAAQKNGLVSVPKGKPLDRSMSVPYAAVAQLDGSMLGRGPTRVQSTSGYHEVNFQT